MRLSDFVLILAKRLFTACLCCAICTFAYADDEIPLPGQTGFLTLLDDGDQTADLAFFALSLSGVHYKYGGSTPNGGMDCSGLVQYVYKEVLGKDLPRSAEEISHVGNIIADHELRPGDLVFFNTLKRAFSHVGIYLGEDRFIHSPSSGGQVRIERMSLHYWKQRFNGARRIIDRQRAAHPSSLE